MCLQRSSANFDYGQLQLAASGRGPRSTLVNKISVPHLVNQIGGRICLAASAASRLLMLSGAFIPHPPRRRRRRRLRKQSALRIGLCYAADMAGIPTRRKNIFRVPRWFRNGSRKDQRIQNSRSPRNHIHIPHCPELEEFRRWTAWNLRECFKTRQKTAESRKWMLRPVGPR